MANMDVTARLTANTADFDSKMQKSGDIATRTAALTEKASERARAAWQKELLAQEKAVQRASEAGRAKELAALRSDILSRSLDKEAQAAEKAANAAGHSVSQLQAVSAAARALEGNAGLRTFERFIASIPGAAAASSMLFPAIGFGTALAVVGKLGFELYETEQKGKHAGEEISRAFSEMSAKLRITNDELELSNSKLGDEIAKLERHPGNGAQTALLEAVVAADKLQESLAGDERALAALLKEHDVSFLSGVLSGVSATSGANKEITDFSKTVEKSGNEARLAYRDQMKAAGSDRDKQEAASKAYYGRMDQIAADAARQMRKRATEIAEVQKESDRVAVVSAQTGRGPGSRFVDMTPQRAAYEGAAELYDEKQRRAQDSGANFELTKKKGQLEGAKADAADINKAAELRLKAYEATLNLEKLQYGVSIKAQYDYWEARRAIFASGSDAYNQVVAKQAALAEEGARKASETIKRFNEEQKRDAETAQAMNATIARANANIAEGNYKALIAAADASRQFAVAHDAMTAKLSEASIQDAAGKTMTKFAAAAQLAAIHTLEYKKALEDLNGQRKEISSDPYLTEAERNKKLGDFDKQRDALSGNRQLQIMQDAANRGQLNTSAMVGATDALDELAASARDSAGETRKLFDSTVNNINDTILKQITGRGQRGDWTKLGQSVFTGIADTGLKKGEGMLLQGLGFGKADGSSEAQALWVKMAAAQGAGSAASGLLGSLFKGGKSSSGDDGDSDSGGGGFGSMLSNIVPFLANGSDNFPGGMAVVGDAGPELVNLPRGSQVIPNSAAFGGETHHHTWNIDARGATDPAQVNRQIMMAAPHIAAAAVKAIHEQRMRRPSSTR